MANSYTERRYAGEHITSEGNGDISREVVTIASGQNLKAARVLGKITANGKYVAVAPAASDGSEVAAAILYDACDASTADQKAVIHRRMAEYNESLLDFGALTTNQIATAKTQLAALQLIARKGV